MSTRAAYLTAVSLLALVAGCGGGSGDNGSAKAPAKAIQPTCGVDTFTPPQIGPAPGKGGWELAYRYPDKAPRPPRPGETTVLTIVEKPPVKKPPKIKGGHDVDVGGRTVSLLNGTARSASIATWTTKTARYLILANGSTPKPIETVIGCLP